MPRKNSTLKDLIDKNEVSAASSGRCSGGSCLRRLGRLLGVVVILLIVLALGYWLYSSPYWPLTKSGEMTKEQQEKIYLKEVSELTTKISKHLLLPTDEVPEIRTIQDAKAATEAQSFFVGTQNGDKVLVYVQARKAIVYSPERDIIVNVGPVFVDDEESANDDKSTTTNKK